MPATATPPTTPEEVSVDDFIDSICYSDPSNVKYAKFVLHFMRLPAVYQGGFRDLISRYRLYGNYQGRRVRINVTSRLGDVGIHFDLTKSVGYDERVSLKEITDFSNHPTLPYQHQMTQ